MPFKSKLRQDPGLTAEGLYNVAGTGWDAIQEQVKKLEKKHALHIASYGEGNERRLTGKHETSSMESFRCSFTFSLLAHRPDNMPGHPHTETDRAGYKAYGLLCQLSCIGKTTGKPDAPIASLAS